MYCSKACRVDPGAAIARSAGCRCPVEPVTGHKLRSRWLCRSSLTVVRGRLAAGGVDVPVCAGHRQRVQTESGSRAHDRASVLRDRQSTDVHAGAWRRSSAISLRNLGRHVKRLIANEFRYSFRISTRSDSASRPERDLCCGGNRQAARPSQVSSHAFQMSARRTAASPDSARHAALTARNRTQQVRLRTCPDSRFPGPAVAYGLSRLFRVLN